MRRRRRFAQIRGKNEIESGEEDGEHSGFLSENVSEPNSRILYCRCAFAQVISAPVKDEVLAGLCGSGASFESVADLCEMSARRDPRLAGLIEGEGPLKIAACYPRAVKWLFHQAGAALPDEGVEVLNMRDTPADAILESLLEGKTNPVR